MREHVLESYCVRPNYLILCHKFLRGRGIFMRKVGDKQRETIRAEFDRSISIDFLGATITSDTGFLLMREMDQRFDILGGA